MRSLHRRLYWTFGEIIRGVLDANIVDRVRTKIVRGKSIRVGQAGPLEGYRIASYDSKEPETLDWLDQNLRPGDVLFDIGANIGLYSMYAAAVQPTARVYAFEPVATNMVRLMRNVSLNGFANIVPMNMAVSDRSSFNFMALSALTPGAALHEFGGANKTILSQGGFSCSLDELVSKHGLPQPQLVKIDVDGHEGAVINGARTVFSSPLCRSVLVEFSQAEAEGSALYRLLVDCGFKQTAVSAWELKMGGATYRNYIFTKAALA